MRPLRRDGGRPSYHEDRRRSLATVRAGARRPSGRATKTDRCQPIDETAQAYRRRARARRARSRSPTTTRPGRRSSSARRPGSAPPRRPRPPARAHRLDVRARPRRPSRSSTSRLIVADSGDEPAYVPRLEAAGYALRIREPDWYEHRVFKGPDTNVNLHVFSPGRPEIERMVGFRDWLRTHDDDRELYERRSASWPRATGSTSRTTPTRRPRSSRRSSRGRWPTATRRHARVDIDALQSLPSAPRT